MKKADKPDSDLLFQWELRESRGAWLLTCFIATLVAISSLFLIFRIVPPEPPKLTTRPQQMIVLNPANPAERSLIHRAQDSSFTLIPTVMPGQQIAPSMAVVPQFQPSIRSFELKLKESGREIRASERPSLLQQDYLDSLSLLPAKKGNDTDQAPLSSALVLQVRNGMSREMISGRDLSGITLVDPARPVFHVAIGNLGQVLMALPLNASEDPVVMVQLHAAVTQARFQPKPEQLGHEWVEVGFAWKKGGKQ